MAQALAEPAASEGRLKRLYGVETLDGFGQLSGAEVSALGLIAAHLEATQGGQMPALRAPRRAGEADDHGHRSGHARVSWRWRKASRAAATARFWPPGPHGHSRPARDYWPLVWPGRCWMSRRSTPGWTLSNGSLSAAMRVGPCAKRCARRPDMARALSRLALGRGGPRDLAALRDSLGVGEALSKLDSPGPTRWTPRRTEVAEALAAIDPAHDRAAVRAAFAHTGSRALPRPARPGPRRRLRRALACGRSWTGAAPARR